VSKSPTANRKKMSPPALLLRVVLVVAPAIIVSASAVVWGRNALIAHGVNVNEHAYNYVLIAVVLLATSLTMRPILSELHRRKRESAQRSGP
jgi:hypothetical protein